jgi:hypothetical protein
VKIGSCLGPALWAEVATQALSTYRVGLALRTIGRASDRDRVVLFRVMPRAGNRARPIWNTIITLSRRSLVALAAQNWFSAFGVL